MNDDWRALNRANWDERVAVHMGPGGYDLTALRAGRGVLDPIAEAEFAVRPGERVLHLQCHFGEESLTLAQRVAAVTGLDFSPAAIAAAHALGAELGLAATFVCADLYDAPKAVPGAGGFDRVFTTWGTTTWLPDIARWARVVAACLRPGGTLYFADAHPVALVFDDVAATPDGKPGWFAPYFARAPVPYDDPGDYANPDARLVNPRQVNWLHPLGDVLAALREAGLELLWLREHDRITWRMFRMLEPGADGMWAWPGRPWLPLSYSLAARKGDAP